MGKIDHQFIRSYYDSFVGSLDQDYEDERWNKDIITRLSYEQTKRAILFGLSKIKKGNSVEIGCGTAIWTPFLAKASKKVVAVDISKEMLKRAKKKIKEKNVSFECSDFMKWKKQKADAIFSSRAIEYFSNKPAAVKKMFDILSPQGTLVLITKNPYHIDKIVYDMINWVKGGDKEYAQLHSGQISPKDLKRICKRAGFKKVVAYPVVYEVLNWKGLIKSLTKSQKKSFRSPLKALSHLWCESYMVVAKK